MIDSEDSAVGFDSLSVLNTICTVLMTNYKSPHVSVESPGLARAPRAPLFVDSALVEVGLPELWAAAAAAANVAKFCS